MASSAVFLCQSRAACQTPNGTDEDKRVAELAEANEATLARIRTANVKAVFSLVNVDPKSYRYKSNYREFHWTKKDEIERLGVTHSIAAAVASVENPNEPILAKEMCFLQLDRVNRTYRKFERKVLPAAYSVLANKAFEDSACEATLSRWQPSFQIHYMLGLKFYLNAHDETRTLKEMVAEWPAEYRGTGEVDGAECEIIRVVHPGTPGRGETPVDFYLDRKAGTMIRRFVVHHKTGQLVETVKRFYRGWNGVVFPLEREGGFRPNDPKLASQALVGRTRVTSYTLNGKVPDEEVRIPFPKGTEVRIYSGPMEPQSMPPQTHWGVVGKDGQITQRFKVGSAKWDEYRESSRRAMPNGD
jgi:hypothetical protein